MVISAKMGNTIRPVLNEETVVKYFVAVLELKMFLTMFKPRGARYSTQVNAGLCIFTLVELQHEHIISVHPIIHLITFRNTLC